MKKPWVENMIAGSYAIALHIVLMVLLFMGFDSDSEKAITPAAANIVQASVLDQQQVLDNIADRKARVEEKKIEEKLRLDAIKKKEVAEKAAKERAELELETTRLRIEQEKQRQLDLVREKKIEQQKKQEEEAKRKVDAKQKRLAEEKRLLQQKKVEELERKLQQEQENRKAAEVKRLKVEKERKAVEEKKRQQAEKKRLVEEEKLKKAEADRLIKESLAAEELEREERRISGVVNQHMGMIRQRIKRYWSEPGNAVKGMQATLHVTLLPGGDVRQVVVIKSSGDAVFDRSAESAVYKAAPWPQPTDPKAAAELRNFKFVFNPT
jgi:colicin import membrane protein